jgi:hypothetical protein
MMNEVSKKEYRFSKSCAYCHNLSLGINAEKDDDTD